MELELKAELNFKIAPLWKTWNFIMFSPVVSTNGMYKYIEM